MDGPGPYVVVFLVTVIGLLLYYGAFTITPHIGLILSWIAGGILAAIGVLCVSAIGWSLIFERESA